MALLPSPWLHPDGKLELKHALPPRAATLVLRHPTKPDRVVRVDKIGTAGLVVEGATGVVSVRVDDADGIPFLMGVPYVVPRRQLPPTPPTPSALPIPTGKA